MSFRKSLPFYGGLLVVLFSTTYCGTKAPLVTEVEKPSSLTPTIEATEPFYPTPIPSSSPTAPMPVACHLEAELAVMHRGETAHVALIVDSGNIVSGEMAGPNVGPSTVVNNRLVATITPNEIGIVGIEGRVADSQGRLIPCRGARIAVEGNYLNAGFYVSHGTGYYMNDQHHYCSFEGIAHWLSWGGAFAFNSGQIVDNFLDSAYDGICSADVCGVLLPGHSLLPGQSIRSCNNRHTLTMQFDQNLVLTGPQGIVWSSATGACPTPTSCPANSGPRGNRATMQGDGNFVLYQDGAATWNTNTYGFGTSFLALQDDGNLVVYYPTTQADPLWSWITGSLIGR